MTATDRLLNHVQQLLREEANAIRKRDRAMERIARVREDLLNIQARLVDDPEALRRFDEIMREETALPS